VDEQIGTTDAQWALISPLLPSEGGRGCRPAGDNRPFFDGMMWMARTGAQWRRLPPEYGKWNSVFRRYRRWVELGVFDALLETLDELAARDLSADMIDSTVLRAHHCAAGIKKGLGQTTRLAAHAADFPQNCTPDVTHEDCHSALSRHPARRTTSKALARCSG